MFSKLELSINNDFSMFGQGVRKRRQGGRYLSTELENYGLEPWEIWAF